MKILWKAGSVTWFHLSKKWVYFKFVTVSEWFENVVQEDECHWLLVLCFAPVVGA